MTRPQDFLPSLSDYTNTFVQRYDRYGVKFPGRAWKTKTKPLSDRPVQAHLGGAYFVGSLARYYPEFCILDVDDRPEQDVRRIQEYFGLSETNSLLCGSESPNSWHIMIRPELSGRPTTTYQIQERFREAAKHLHIEIYPQKRRLIRLPFGPHQPLFGEQYAGITNWQERLYWFQKLDAFPLEGIPNSQTELGLHVKTRPRVNVQYTRAEAADLLKHGLQALGTRHESQFKIVLYLWRSGVDPGTVENIVWDWIRKKHNGHSKDILKNPEAVRAEIKRQVVHVFSKYDTSRIYPDTIHNGFNGFASRADVEKIIRISSGSLPRTRFLFNLISYANPRRIRPYISVHSDLLVQWASYENYLERIRELEQMNILKRFDAFHPGIFAKNIRLNWQYSDKNKAILHDERALDGFEETAKQAFGNPRELRELFEAAGAKERRSYKIVKQVYDSGGRKAQSGMQEREDGESKS